METLILNRNIEVTKDLKLNIAVKLIRVNDLVSACLNTPFGNTRPTPLTGNYIGSQNQKGIWHFKLNTAPGLKVWADAKLNG